MSIGQVRLGREAVVTNVDPDLLHLDVLDVQRVEEVGVLRERRCLGFLDGALVSNTTCRTEEDGLTAVQARFLMEMS
jgi:hypothetical protein